MKNTPTEMQAWMALQPTAIRNRLMVRSHAEAGDMFHMSVDGTIKRFTPYVTRRTGHRENTSIPRVSVAPSIMGCYIGYAAAMTDYMWGEWGKGKDKWKGGWYLYRIPYEYCIRPHVKELYDVEDTAEHWLVGYSPETVHYTPELVGSMIPVEMTHRARDGRVPEVHQVLLVEVLIDEVCFAGTKVLSKGYWRISGPEMARHGVLVKHDDYRIEKITVAEWATAKKLCADMLSLTPPAFKW